MLEGWAGNQDSPPRTETEVGEHRDPGGRFEVCISAGLRLLPVSGLCWAAGSREHAAARSGRGGLPFPASFAEGGGTWASCDPGWEINPLLTPKLGSQRL